MQKLLIYSKDTEQIVEQRILFKSLQQWVILILLKSI